MKFQSTSEELPPSSLPLLSLRESGWASACCEFLVSENADEASLSFSKVIVLWCLRGFGEYCILISVHPFFSLKEGNWLVGISAHLVKHSGFRTMCQLYIPNMPTDFIFPWRPHMAHLSQQMSLDSRRTWAACTVPVLSATGAQPQRSLGCKSPPCLGDV